MQVLILGGGGMLGHKLVQMWRERFDVWTTLRGNFESVEQFDIFDRQKTIPAVNAENFDLILNVFDLVKPKVVINCIGVIKQLPTAKDPLPTLSINSIFPHRVAKLCRAANARFINLSTDCVFSGARGNYLETDTPDAVDLYGQSKHWGEVTNENCLTIRTSIIGRELGTAHSLVDWFLSNRGLNQTLKGFTRAIYTGFPTIVLADILADVIETKTSAQGLWHLSSDPINKFDLLQMINKEFKANLEIEPDSNFHCDRSLNSEGYRREFNFKPQPWPRMIKQMAEDPTPYDEFQRKW